MNGVKKCLYFVPSQYEIEYPNMCELIAIRLAIAPSTGVLE